MRIAPAHGTLTGTAARPRYTPPPNYHGPDSFTFRAWTDSLDSNPRDVRSPCSRQRPPDRGCEAAQTPLATPLGALLEGADRTATRSPSRADPGARPADGYAARAVYTPAAGFSGGDSFTYRAYDGRPSRRPRRSRSPLGTRPRQRPADGHARCRRPGRRGVGAPLSASAADPDGDALSYTWSTTSARSRRRAGSSLKVDDGPALAHVSVKADDGHGHQAGDAKNVTVRNVPADCHAGQRAGRPLGPGLLFAGTASDPSAADTAAGLQPLWSFGDGAAANGVSAHATPRRALHRHPVRRPTRTAVHSAPRRSSSRGARGARLHGPAALGFGAFTISGRLTDGVGGRPLAGRTVVFTVDGGRTRRRRTARGRAAPARAAAGSPAIGLAFAGDTLYLDSTASATLASGSSAGKVTAGGLKTRDGGRGGLNAQWPGRPGEGRAAVAEEGARLPRHTRSRRCGSRPTAARPGSAASASTGARSRHSSSTTASRARTTCSGSGSAACCRRQATASSPAATSRCTGHRLRRVPASPSRSSGCYSLETSRAAPRPRRSRSGRAVAIAARVAVQRDEPGRAELREMVMGRRAREADLFRQLGERRLRTPEAQQDRDPLRVAERPPEPLEPVGARALGIVLESRRLRSR